MADLAPKLEKRVPWGGGGGVQDDASTYATFFEMFKKSYKTRSNF